jgi:ubiquinone/menaquinone biosynthesis C-methylase UbiE
MIDTTNQLVLDYVRAYHQDCNVENELDKVASLMQAMDTRHLQELFSKYLAGEPKSVLDVGCGTGRFLRSLPLNWVKVGIEYRPEAARIANLLRNEHTFIHQGVAEHMAFPNNTFDVVVSFQVLEHVSNVSKAIEEMFRVVRPGGIVYGTLPNKRHPREPHVGLLYPHRLPMWLRRPYIDTFSRNLNRKSQEFNYLRNINYLTPQELIQILQQYSRTVVHLTPERLHTRLGLGRQPLMQTVCRILANYAGIEFVAIKK